nr:hypothetical protein [Tanacetum cinerariifolium]
ANLGSPTKKGKKTKPHVIPYCRFTKLIIYYFERHHNIHQRSGSPLNLAEDDLSLENLKFVPKGKIDEVFGMQRKAIATEEQDAQSMLALHTPKRKIRETPSPADTETGADTDMVISEGDTKILNIVEEQGEDVDNKVNLEERTVELDEGQAGSDPVILEDPLCSSGTLSSMKILDDTYTFEDHFFNEKSTKDEPGKQNVDAKVVSMVTVPIHQASTSVPPLSTLIIDLLALVGYTLICMLESFTKALDLCNMNNENVLALALTRSDDQILPFTAWRHHNIHQRSGSPLNFAEDDLSLENLKFVPKGKIDEVFGMQIPKELITDNIRNAPYYNTYLEMVAKHEQKIVAEKEGGKKKTAPKADKPMKPAPAKQAKPATTLQPKPKSVKEKSTKPTPQQKAGKAKVIEARNVKNSLQLVDERDEEQDQPKHAPGQAHVGGVAIREPVAEATGPLPVDDTSATIVRETPSPTDAKIGDDTDKERTVELDEGQAGSDPGKSYVALAGPNPESMHDDFVATVYPKVHESLKFLTDEQVILEDPLSSSETLSSMKILDDTYTFGDQFFNENQPNMNQENRMWMLKLYPCKKECSQPLKSVASPLLEPFITPRTETTITTLPLPLPPQQQSTTDSELAARVTALEKKFSNFEQKSQTLNNTTQNLGSRKSQTLNNTTQNLGSKVFTLELRDLPYKINQTVNEVVKEAIHVDFQASLRDRFRELPEADMKEILPQRMFESDWIIPLTDLPDAENNWADALAKSYKDPKENKLLSKTGDMGSFIKWFYKRIGKKKLSKSDLEGPAFKVVKAFHENSISLQFQIEECHRLLTDQVDLVNPKGHRLVPDVSKPLPLGGPSGQVTIQS